MDQRGLAVRELYRVAEAHLDHRAAHQRRGDRFQRRARRGRVIGDRRQVRYEPRLSGTLALYDIDKKNVLVSQLNSAPAMTEFHTAGKARSRGVELDVTGKADRQLEPDRQLWLYRRAGHRGSDLAGKALQKSR